MWPAAGPAASGGRGITERLFSTYEVADLLGATPGAVVQWIEKGWLPCRRLPSGPVRIAESGLVQFLKRQGVDLMDIVSRLASQTPAPAEGAQRAAAVDAPAAAETPEPIRPDEAMAAVYEGDVIDVEDAAFLGDAPQDDAVIEAQTIEEDGPPAAPTADAEPAAAQQVPDPSDARPAERPGPAQGDDRAAAAAQVAGAVLAYAADHGVEEVHFEPGPDGLALRMRIDGVLHEKFGFRQRLPAGVGPALIAHFKRLAGLDAARCDRPQAGEMVAEVAGRTIEMTAATCPTTRGESLLVRLLAAPIGLDALDLEAADRGQLGEALPTGQVDAGGGMIVVTGPQRTRGRLLRAMLAQLAGPRVKALAIEVACPVGANEAELPTVQHVRVGPAGRVTPAEAVASAVRQRPEAMMVWDLPDPPTTEAVLAAALDATVVLAGLAAAGPVAAIVGLMDMCVATWSVASGVRLVVEARTVRLLCPRCKRPAPGGAATFEAVGCRHCAAGYRGRRELLSLLPMTGPLAQAVRSGADAATLQRLARQAGMKTIGQAAEGLVAAGLISAAEAARVVGERPRPA